MNFFESVYEVVKRIPKGKVTTYGIIAEEIGNKRASRAVGWALNSNPDNSKIPCHRVVNREGRLSKAFAFGGINRQRELLAFEGIEFKDDEKVDLDIYLYRFK
ncbi:MAG: MGMT family protein [Clostridia bacterium]|jgi:methylated-DNA-protein-cysteine methyltransferase-like protein|nr:MGMT family protein [Clostridia bacterium]